MRKLSILLSFLEEGKKYSTQVFEDAPTMNTRTNVGIRSVIVTKDTALELELISSGGAAIHKTLQQDFIN